MTLAEKMSQVAAECGFAQFDSKNDFHRYRYASAASIIRMVNKSLTARGIAVGTQSELLHFGDFEDAKGKRQQRAVVRLTLSFTDGDSVLTCQGIGEGTDTGDKAIYKANTGAYKYALAHGLTMAWGAEDPEGDSTTDANTQGKDDAAGQTKKKSGSKAKKADKPSTSAADLSKAIATADGLKALETLKESIRKFRDSDRAAFDKLVTKYREREEALKETK